jgi:transglutaminase-like putative cysteine protease
LARTALLSALPAALIATGWRQLESPPEGRQIALVALLGVAVALVPRLRVVASIGATLVVAHLAFGLTPVRDLAWDLWNGTLDYYEVTLPFDPGDRKEMHGVVLLAVFVFTLAASLAIARRRAVLAAAITFAGAAWPVTLIRHAPSTVRGALLLVAALILLAALRKGARRGAAQAVLVGAGVVVAALVAVSSPAVAKGEFLNWEHWEPYTRPQKPVSVSYVWDADYSGIRLPKRPTTVLTIKAPRRVSYWRATTLDSFIDDHWRESAVTVDPIRLNGQDALISDPLVPPQAREPSNWTKQEVTVRALRDTHLVGSTVPVAFEPGEAMAYSPGVAYVASMHRNQDYKVWSYVPQPTPRQLARSRPDYPAAIALGGAFLDTEYAFAPPFGTPERDARMRELFSESLEPSYRRLYETALRVVGHPRNPYAAVVALEAWFRTGGNFQYDESPPVRLNVPPLVAFVEDHRRGYCQHFAGAMALMLRYLGIPARVGAGFTLGRYDEGKHEWTVADTNAHTWVEAWFKGYGWLPFDPTPGPGRLQGSYTSSSLFFDATGATSAFAGIGASALGLRVLRAQITAARKGTNGSSALDPSRARGAKPGGGGVDTGRGGSLLGLLLLLAATLTAALWVLKFARRHRRYATRDPRRLAGAVRLDLVDYLVDQRVPVSQSATPAELGVRLEREMGVRSDRLAEALSEARYGPDEGAPSAADHARKELRGVRRAIRRRLSTGARLRGLLSLRSLGLGA